MAVRSPGLKRPSIAPELRARLPPGQYLTTRWPAFHEGPVPRFDPQTWDLHLHGLVEHELRLGWGDVLALPRITIQADMHCVTRWSKLDSTWEGIPARLILERAGVLPTARYVLFHCEGGYTANIPREVFNADDVVLAVKHNGENLTPEHGYPLRVVIPQRYAWKSAKWLRAIEFLPEDQPGFWERYGYHNDADPWREERFAAE